MWQEVQPGEIVYIQDGNGHALGPHQVVDPQAHTLRNVARQEAHTVDDEIMIYKKGPLVVVTLLNNRFNAIYADVPLEIVAIHMNEMADTLFAGDIFRPRTMDELPTDFGNHLARMLPPGYPEMYGQWDIEQCSAAHRSEKEKAQELVNLRVTNSIAAKSLTVELIQHKLAFSVVEVDVDGVLFSMTNAVLNHITQHVTALAEGMAHVE